MTSELANIFDRAFEIAASALGRAPHDDLAHPFGLNSKPGWRWRVSSDVWDELEAEGRRRGVYPVESAHASLLGYPIGIDKALPANSMVLEYAARTGEPT